MNFHFSTIQITAYEPDKLWHACRTLLSPCPRQRPDFSCSCQEKSAKEGAPPVSVCGKICASKRANIFGHPRTSCFRPPSSLLIGTFSTLTPPCGYEYQRLASSEPPKGPLEVKETKPVEFQEKFERSARINRTWRREIFSQTKSWFCPMNSLGPAFLEELSFAGTKKVPTVWLLSHRN